MRDVTGRVARNAALVMALLALDKLLGVVRDVAVGRAFGASAALDAYYAAFEVPDGLFTIVAGAALTTSLIPVLSEFITRTNPRAVWRLASGVINVVLLVVAACSALAWVFAPQIMQLVAPGFGAAQVALAVRLMRLVLIQTVISSASGVVMSALQAHQHFLLPAMAPVVYTGGRIVGALFLAPHMGIFGLAWGGLLGTAGHLLVQVPGLLRYRARWQPVLFPPGLRQVLALMAPRMLTLVVVYLGFVLPTFLGSRLEAGAISAYEYGWRLMQFPETIFGTALALVAFPTLARLASAGDEEGVRRTATWALRMILALTIPAGVGLVLLGRPLTALVFQRGAFDAETTSRVYLALQFFGLGLVGHSALEVVSRLYYARKDMWTPLGVALLAFTLNLGLGAALLPLLAQGALALSNSLAACFSVAALLLLAARRGRGVQGGALLRSLLRTLAASGAMALAVWGFRLLVADRGLLVVGGGGLAVGAVVYVAAALLLGSEELRTLPGLLLQRSRRSSALAELSEPDQQ